MGVKYNLRLVCVPYRPHIDGKIPWHSSKKHLISTYYMGLCWKILPEFQMVHFQRVLSNVFRFTLTVAFLYYSITVSSFTFFVSKLKRWRILKWWRQHQTKCRFCQISDDKVQQNKLKNQDLLRFCERPTDTKVCKLLFCWNEKLVEMRS